MQAIVLSYLQSYEVLLNQDQENEQNENRFLPKRKLTQNDNDQRHEEEGTIQYLHHSITKGYKKGQNQKGLKTD